MSRNQAREARTHRCANHQRRRVTSRHAIECHEITDVVEVVAHRHHGDPRLERGRRQGHVRSRLGQHEYPGETIIVVTRTEMLSSCGCTSAETRNERRHQIGPDIVHLDLDRLFGSEDDPGNPGAHCSDADDANEIGHADRSTGSSRQPPFCGGIPPLPRTRSAPAMTPAMESAMRARRSNFMAVTLTGRAHERFRR